MHINIRSITNEEVNSFLNHYKSVCGDFDSQNQEKNFQEYIRFKPYLVKIAIVANKIVGFVIGVDNASHKARIHTIYVDKRFRNQNIGTQLLEKIEKELIKNSPQLEYLSVRIEEGSYDSLAFFMKSDYELVTKINNYVKDNLSFNFPINEDVVVRKAIEDDVSQLLKIENNCFPYYWRISKHEFANIIRTRAKSLFVAIIEDKMIGYNYNTISEDGVSGNYVRIATLPNYRQLHIGTTLTKAAFEWFRDYDVKRVLLSTYADSEVHNQLYKSWGFYKTDEETILAKNYKSIKKNEKSTAQQ